MINNDIISVNLSLEFLININLFSFFFYYRGCKIIRSYFGLLIDKAELYQSLPLIFYAS